VEETCKLNGIIATKWQTLELKTLTWFELSGPVAVNYPIGDCTPFRNDLMTRAASFQI
jgi:hypothetical protein